MIQKRIKESWLFYWFRKYFPLLTYVTVNNSYNYERLPTEKERKFISHNLPGKINQKKVCIGQNFVVSLEKQFTLLKKDKIKVEFYAPLDFEKYNTEALAIAKKNLDLFKKVIKSNFSNTVETLETVDNRVLLTIIVPISNNQDIKHLFGQIKQYLDRWIN